MNFSCYLLSLGVAGELGDLDLPVAVGGRPAERKVQGRRVGGGVADVDVHWRKKGGKTYSIVASLRLYSCSR